MRFLLDACVLYPTVMREMLLGVAASGAFQPFWSPRILEEWARATRKIGPDGEMQARAEIALLQARWPDASVQPRAGDMARLYLPDENDIHVLAAGIACSADAIVTLNARDFPKNILAEEGLKRFSPDELMMNLMERSAENVHQSVRAVHAEAERLSGDTLPLRGLLKRARMPRLGKALNR